MRNIQKIVVDEKTYNDNYPTFKILDELGERFRADAKYQAVV